MDSSPDLSVKLRRGSSDSRDSFYMGFAQGIDSDIEEVTTVQSAPPPPQYPAQEEPPIEIPPPLPELSPEPSNEIERFPDNEIIEGEEELNFTEVIAAPAEYEAADEVEVDSSRPIEPSQLLIEQIPPPPPLLDDDEDETNTSVTVIQTKNKTPSSSSSSISSALNELAADEGNKSLVDSPKPNSQSFEAEISHDTTSPPSQKSQKSQKSHKSPPKKLNLIHKDTRQRNFDSDSIDSINAIDCKIDDDNRDDSSPTDSMPPAPTPPPLENVLSLEKR